jgi:hypothetical protein
VGVILVIAPVTTRLFDRTSAAQRLTDRIRPAMTTASLDKLRQDFDTGRSAGTELINGALPALAPRLGQTPDQLNASIQANYPDVAEGFRQFPGIASKVDGVLTLFEKDQAEFHAADTTPTSWLPFTVGPWLMVLFGLALIGMGLLVLRSGRTWPVVAAGVAGLALAVGPLAVSFPHKTSQSAALVDDLRPLITRPTADAVKGWQATMEKMTAQLQGQMLPALAAQLNETPEQLTATLATGHPAVASGLPRLGAVFTDFADKTKRLDASVGDFAKTKEIPYRTLPWLFIPPGVALVLGSAAALAARRRRSPASEPAMAVAVPAEPSPAAVPAGATVPAGTTVPPVADVPAVATVPAGADGPAVPAVRAVPNT